MKAMPNRSIAALTPDALAHRRRCRTLPPVQPGEAERLMADFLATKVSPPATRYAAPIEQCSQHAQIGY